jgi:hypothetical protein
MPFLVERLVAYLTRDFAGVGVTLTGRDILVGTASYPGVSRTSGNLLNEAEQSLKPHADA